MGLRLCSRLRAGRGLLDQFAGQSGLSQMPQEELINERTVPDANDDEQFENRQKKTPKSGNV